MGDKETKLRGQVINKPKEQMWMLKSESVSGNLVNFLGTFFIVLPQSFSVGGEGEASVDVEVDTCLDVQGQESEQVS